MTAGKRKKAPVEHQRPGQQVKNGRLYCSYLKEPGKPERVYVAFGTDQAAANGWYDACEFAGGPVDPEPFLNRRRNQPAPGGAHAAAPIAAPSRPGRPLESWAWEWWHETYIVDESSSIGGREQAEADLRNVILPWFGDFPDIRLITRKSVSDWLRFKAGQKLPEERIPEACREGSSAVEVPTRLPEKLTLMQCSHATGIPKSTLKRWRLYGKFPNARKEDTKAGSETGAWLIPADDLTAVVPHLRATTPMASRTGYSKQTMKQALSTLRRVITYAIGEGALLADPTAGLEALRPAPHVAMKKPNRVKRKVAFSLERTARLVRHLPEDIQLVVWIIRLTGLRLGEVYGIRLKDLVDFGTYGVLTCVRQGGKKYKIRDLQSGEELTVWEKDLTKTGDTRVVVFPGPLMDLVRYMKLKYHADETGHVDPNARLVPGKTRYSRAEREYARALRAENLGYDGVGFHNSLHHQRGSFATYLRKLVPGNIISQILGHAMRPEPGEADMTAEVYTFWVEELEPLIDAADQVTTMILDEIGLLFEEAPQEPEPATPGYRANQAAEKIGVSRTAINNWIKAGYLVGVTDVVGRNGVYRWLPAEEVERVARHLSERWPVAEVEKVTGFGTHQLWRWIRQGKLKADRDFLGDIVVDPAEVQRLVAESKRLERLHQRAMSLGRAAEVLETSTSTVEYMVKVSHVLELDPERDMTGTRYVTRASVEREQARRRERARRSLGNRRLVDAAEWINLDDAVAGSGLRKSELIDLIRTGVLEKRMIGSRAHVRADALTKLSLAPAPASPSHATAAAVVRMPVADRSAQAS